MASKDIINPVDVSNPSATRRSSDLLPNYHRTDKNTKFLASTLDQLIQQPQIKRIDGFVGSKLSPKFDPLTDQYIDGTTKLRNDYQLEPSLVIQDSNQNIKQVLGYDDLINQLSFNNSITSNLDKLFRPQSYSYDPQIDWDKFVNFRQYYWLPTGPDTIVITGQPRDTISTYTVRDSENKDSLIFTPDGGTTNPLLTLYRGLTYVFNVTSVYPFYVKTAYGEGTDSLYANTTNNGAKVGQIIVTIDEFTPNTLFYYAEGSRTAVGKFVVKTIEENTVLDIEKDILGKKKYTSGNRVTFTNGMKVRFVGEVTPENYLDKDFIVEGVGDKIVLVDYSKLQPTGIETTNLTVNFDTNPFDEYPFDDFRFVPITPDYTTINRSSIDRNPWSRYNRWVHADVIQATAIANGVPPVYPTNQRAQRPIIEFNAGIQLHNFGSIGKDNIDLIDTKTTDVFKTVEGAPGHYIDGQRIAAGNRVIFNADTDPLVRGKVYEVKFAVIDNQQFINLEEVLDSQPLLNEAIVVSSGTLYAGTAWWFNGNTWQLGQQRKTVNQPPLWELYDADGNRYADQSFYKSTFEGTKLFGYTVGTVTDSVLGFNVAFRNINNVGEFLFNNYFGTDTFSNFVNGEIVEIKVSDGYLKINRSTGEQLKTIWTKTVDKPIPILQYQVLTENSVYVEINSIDRPGYVRDLTVDLFVNDIKQTRNEDYIVSSDNERLYLVSTGTFSTNDRVLIKLYTDRLPNQNGFYEPAANLTNNPLNQSISNFTFTEVSDHVKSIVDFNGEFVGKFPGLGNLRDLGNLSAYGSRIVSHDNPLSFAHYFLGTRENNIVDAVRKVSDDYNQFKTNLIRYITELRGIYSPGQSLDTAMLKLNSLKDSASNYKNSDMLAYGNDQKTRIFTVTNSRNLKYSLASQYDDTVLSERAVLVYHSRKNATTNEVTTQLLTKGYDYVVNKFDASITIKFPLLKNDQLTVKDYPSTVGSYVPPTPTKLGIYPKFRPQLYKDNTYITDQWVIQGHDGSITIAFGNYDLDNNGNFLVDDYRDAVLLEYEIRVYNNLKVEHNSELLNVNKVIPGGFRSTGYSQEDVAQLIAPDFLKWTGFFGVDYQTNTTLNETNSFTFNYSSNIDSIAKNRLTGFWRSVYKHFYDTDRPHTHPWEMLGFSEEPTWWVSTYGPAPYTSGNQILWKDLEEGRIAVTSTGPVINSLYIRPGLSNIIPVDEHGNLVSPAGESYDSEGNLVSTRSTSLASTPIVDLDDPRRLVVLRTDQISAKWKIGDQGPAETAWRRSSYWPYACQILLALTKPATYAALMFDPSRIKKNLADEYRYGENRVFLNPSQVSLFNDNLNDSRVLAAGYSQFIIETGTSKNTNYIENLKNDLANLNYQLMVKIGGFANKEKLQVNIDAVDPTSPYPGVLIPSEDYEIFFNQSSPIESLDISGLIIQKTGRGWSVRGYDKYKPYFTVFKPVVSNVDQIERVGGVSESFSNWVVNTTYQEGQVLFYNDRYYRVLQRHNSDEQFNSIYYQSLPYLPVKGGVGVFRRSAFDTVEIKVPYGTEFTSVQEVYDLIIGYGRWVESKGFAFEEYNTDLEQMLDWNFTSKEFLYWTTQNWAVNSVITLSPFANKLIFRSDRGVVDSITNSFYEYSLLKADGAPFPKNNFTIVRLDGEFVLSTINTLEGLFFVKINVVQKEHALVMKNTTLFNDTVYDPKTGYRQRRLNVKGFITRDWNGDFFSPGFVFDQAVINDWQKFVDYGVGEVVRFSGNYYAAIKSIPGSNNFDIVQWAVLNEKPTPQLLPNFEYKINQFEDFYSLDIDNFDIGQQSMAQYLVGYTPRPYLNFIIGDPIAQYKFYQGFIRDKGSKKSLVNLSKASFNNFRSTIDFNEEWAFRIGYYGGFNTYQELETSLEFNKFIENPQIIEFVQDTPPGESNNIYYKKSSDIIVKPENFNINQVFATTSTTYTENNFKLPVAGYVRLDDITATAYNKNSVLDIANNSSLITGSTIWLGFREDGEWDVLRVTDLPTVITAVAINIPGQSITLTTFYTHQLNVNDLISVTGIESSIDQCYIVKEILNENQFVVLSILTILPELPDTITGSLFIFKSSRLSTFDDLSRIPFLDRWNDGEKVWIDDNGTSKWAVYRKTNNYNASLYPAPFELAGQHYASKIVANTNSNIIIVSSPDSLQTVLGQPQSGKIYVLFRDTFGAITVLSDYSLNDDATYHGTAASTTSTFGFSLAYDPTVRLVVAGAPDASEVKPVLASTTNIIDIDAFPSTGILKQGVVKLNLLDSEGYDTLNTLIFPDSSKGITTTSTTAGAEFGTSVALSTGVVDTTTGSNTATFALLVGAPGVSSNRGAVYKFDVIVTTGTVNTVEVLQNVTPSLATTSTTANSRFGTEISGSADLSLVAVTAPGHQSISSRATADITTVTGAIFIYDFTTSTEVQQIITGSFANFGNNEFSELDQFASKIKMSKDGEFLAVGSPLAFDNGLGIRSGVVDIFTNANNVFVYNQRISVPISALTSTTKFGWDIDFNNDATTLVITSIGTAKSVTPTFDRYSERYSLAEISEKFPDEESIFINDPTSLERILPTTFDGGSTLFKSQNSFAGTAHVYNRLGDADLKQFAFAQSLNSSEVQEQSAFGYSVTVTDNEVFVGAPAKPAPAATLLGTPAEAFTGLDNGGGQLFIFDKIDQSATSWQLFREQEDSVDLAPIRRAITINTDSEQIQNYIDVIDPIKGNILGTAAEELRYITPYDPAIYSLGIDGVNVDPNTNWLDEHIGELWWDLSTVKYVWYEQGELEYRKNNWNNIFPGSSIDVYEWVRSEYLPAEWAQLADTAEGITRGISGQPKFNENTVISVKQVYNSVSNAFTNVYYFWVKNKTTVPSNVANRVRPSFEIAQTIADPVGSGLQFLAILSPTSVMLANAKSLVSSEKINLNIAFDIINDSANRHTEWLLLQENDPNSRPNQLLEKKLIDSLLGRDSLGNQVPDPFLPSKLRYGIEVRPRQSLFVNRLEALRNVIEFTNSVIKNELLTDTINFANLNTTEPLPDDSIYDTIVEDIFTLELVPTTTLATAKIRAVIDAEGQISRIIIDNPGFGYTTAPTITIDGIGTGAVLTTRLNEFGAVVGVDIVESGSRYSSDTLLVVRPYTVLIQTDSNSAGKWAIYEWNDTLKIWIKTRTQSYNTPVYWKYIDWAAPTYDPLKNVVTSIPAVYALEVLETLAVDSYVKVQNSGDGRYIIVRRTDGNGGTFDYNWDLVYSQNGTLQFLDSIWNLTDTIYAWDKLVGWDQTQYDQAPDVEIEFILLAIKDDIFINTLKGYWNQLFFKAVRYALSEQKFLDWAFKTTFISVINNSGSLDQPPTYKLENVKYYEEFLNEVKPYHTKIRRFTQQYTSTELTNTFNTDFDLPAYYNTSTLNFNKVEFGNDLLLQYPWKSWYDNYTYTVETIELYDGGDGYTQTPTVSIVAGPGDSGFGATAVAYIAVGKVSRIIVTNPGQGYTTTPTVILNGGGNATLTPAKAYARLGGSPVRLNSITMKFDRVSTRREIGSQRYTDKFIGDGFDVTFPLTWVPVADKTEITLTRNGSLCLIDSYTILFETIPFSPQDNTQYGKKYAILSLNFIPEAGEEIIIDYPKSLDLYTAVDRIEDYYNPLPGMPGKDVTQLMSGAEYSGLIVEGLPFNFSGGWDTLPYASTSWDNYGLEQGYTAFSTTAVNTSQVYSIPELISTGTEINVYIRRSDDTSVSGVRIDNPRFDNFQGTWTSTSNYSATDIVAFNERYYQTSISIDSSSTFLIPTSTSSWTPVQYSEDVVMTTIIGKGTGAVDQIQVLIPGSGYNAAFTNLSIAPPNTAGGTLATGSLNYKVVNASVVTTASGTGYAIGDVLTVTTGSGTATFAVARIVEPNAVAYGGAVVVNDGDRGQVISLDGIDDYVRFKSSQDYQFAKSDFTVEGFIRTTTATDTILQPIFDFRALSTSSGIGINLTGTNLSVVVDNVQIITTNSVVIVNSWTHVALVRKDLNLRLFVNGLQVGNTATNNKSYSATPWSIGTNNSSTAFFQGFIDDVRVSKGTARYTSTFTITSLTALVADSTSTVFLGFSTGSVPPPGIGSVSAVTILDAGIFSQAGGTPAGEIIPTSTVITTSSVRLFLSHGIESIDIVNRGSGYTEAPAVTIVETINNSNEESSITVPAFARTTLRAEFTEINSSTILNQVTIPAPAFTTPSSLVILRYASSDGTVTPTDQDSLDALIDGGNLSLTTARGVDPSEIILDGGSQSTRHITGMMDDGFLNSVNSPAPEECVPGQIQESIGISVYTQPPTISPTISTKQYWYDGSQLTFKLGIKPTNQDSVGVVYNRQKVSRLQPNPGLPDNFTIDYVNNTVTFNSDALSGSGWVSLTAIQPGSLILLDSLTQISTVTNSTFTSGARYIDVGSSYVTLDGLSLTQNISTLTNAVLTAGQYQITNYRGRARLKVGGTGTVQAYFFKGTEKSFSEIYEQQRVISDSSTLSELLLDRPPGIAAPYHGQVIVTTSRDFDTAKSRLRPPVTTYYQVANDQRIFDISQTTVYPLGNIGAGDLEVYVNGVRKNGRPIWTLNQLANQVEFAPGSLSNNDVIAIVVKRDYDYLIEDGRIKFRTPIVSTNTINPTLSIITFTNHDPNFIRTDRFEANAGGQYTMQRSVLDSSYVWVTFNGKPLIANVDYGIENNNRTVTLRDGLYNNPLYKNETVVPTYEVFETIAVISTSATNYVSGDIVSFDGPGWATPASVELSRVTGTNTISVSRIVNKGVFVASTTTMLPTGLLTPTSVTLNPYLIGRSPTGLLMSFGFKDITSYPTPTVLITSFADVVPLVGYRIFQDMLGRTHYKRLSGENTTVLAQDFSLTDSVIVVEDASVLTPPNPQYNRPGVVLIEGERIEFFVIQGNFLSQLRRSTLGTGPRSTHYAGTSVIDQGSYQTIPFTQDVLQTTSTIAPMSTSTFTVAISNIDFTDLANYWDQVEVKYAGSTLLKPGLTTNKHRIDVAYDSRVTNSVGTSSNVILFNQFTITNIVTTATNTVLLEIYPERIEGFQPGRRIEVTRKTSRTWYDSTNSNTTLTKNNTIQAKFLSDKAAAIPPFMSSSTYVATDLTLYLEDVYLTADPLSGVLTDENDNPLEGI